MYIARKNHTPSAEAAFEFIKKYSFATLISTDQANIEAVHLPIEVRHVGQTLTLSGHVSIANPICDYIENKSSALVIFREPHAYISSSWYDHVNVPTWNYIAVHASGQLIRTEDQKLLEDLNSMVDHYENGRENRYHLSAMPDDMLQAHLNGLMGFEIVVNKLEANFKLSQNRNDKNYNAIIKKLAQSDNMLDREIAKEMRTLRTEERR